MRISDWSSDVCSSDLISLPLPAAVPAALVFPVLRIADPRLALDVVEPGVLDPLARGPDLLASHRAGVAAEALVEVQDLADLCPDMHWAASRSGSASCRERVVQYV